MKQASLVISDVKSDWRSDLKKIADIRDQWVYRLRNVAESTKAMEFFNSLIETIRGNFFINWKNLN